MGSGIIRSRSADFYALVPFIIDTCIAVTAFAIADSVDEAVELANSSDYSLSASLWTSDVYAGQAIASQVRAGEAR